MSAPPVGGLRAGERVWRRVEYKSHPSRYTLDAPAAFVGYPSWRDFTIDAEAPGNDAPLSSGGNSIELPRPGALSRKVLYVAGMAAFIVAAVAVGSGLNVSSNTSQPYADGDIRFGSRPVTHGLPNTVIFEYDVSGVAADSYFIQQSWDDRRLTRISPSEHTLTSTYYEPGYYTAKLIADTTVLREHPLLITTDGWLAYIENESSPTYLDVDRQERGVLQVAKEALENLEGMGDERAINMFNVRRFDSLHTDRFQLETRIRNQASENRYPCKRAEIGVMGEEGIIGFVVGKPGCVGDLGAVFGVVYVDARTNDLSLFGTDLSSWTRIRLSVMDRTVRIQVGDNREYVSRYNDDIGALVGIGYRFEGAGAIDRVTLSDGDGRIVYEEPF